LHGCYTVVFVPPSGFAMRPVNAASASTCGQTGRKEAAEKRERASGAQPPNPQSKGLPCRVPQTLYPLQTRSHLCDSRVCNSPGSN
jgi:hypothetical protein